MNIYRGPKTKDRYDSSHDLVSRVDVSPAQWEADSYVVVANISKDASERSSVAHVVIDELDVCRLHEGMMKKLLKQSEELRIANVHIEALRDLVNQLVVELSYYPPEEAEDLRGTAHEMRAAIREYEALIAEVKARPFDPNSVLPSA